MLAFYIAFIVTVLVLVWKRGIMKNLYLASAILFDEAQRNFGNVIVYGLFNERRNAYRCIEKNMEVTREHVSYIPQVQLVEILDEGCNGNDWPECMAENR